MKGRNCVDLAAYRRTITKFVYMCVVASGFSERNTTRLSHEPVLGGTRKLTVESDRRGGLETMTSAVSLQSAQPLKAPGATKSHYNRSSDILTVSLAVVSLFLLVLLLTFSVSFVIFLSRYGNRRGRCDRRWPTQRFLLSDGENGDSVSSAASAKPSGGEDLSSEFSSTVEFF